MSELQAIITPADGDVAAVAAAATAASTNAANDAVEEVLNADVEDQALAANRPMLRLTRPRKQAAQLVRNQIKIGTAIRDQRIADLHDLDTARNEKQEWVGRTSDLLNQLFSDPRVAERASDWVGPILPEYAEFGMFVELFGHEMKHRLSRLQSVLKTIEETPEPIATRRRDAGGASSSANNQSAAAAGPAEAAATAAAPVAQPAAAAAPAAEVAAPAAVVAVADPAPAPSPAVAAAPAAPAAAPVSAGPTYVDASEDEDDSNATPDGSTQPMSTTVAQQPAPTFVKMNSAAAPAPAQPAQAAAPAASAAPSRTAAASSATATGLLFASAGQDDSVRQAVAEFLERLGVRMRNAVAFTDGAPPLIEQLDQHRDAAFALILSAGNNQAAAHGEFLFHLGCLVGRMGAGRVCLLTSDGSASATDHRGIRQITMDPSDGWQLQLARHLKSGGVRVDLNKLL